MENAESVDVSWLHHSQKDNLGRTRSASSAGSNKADPTQSKQSDGHKPQPPTKSPETNGSSPIDVPTPKSAPAPGRKDAKQGQGTPESTALRDSPSQMSSAQSSNTSKPVAARPPTPRRNSWISSLSSKFSAGSTPPSANPLKDHGNKAQGAATESVNPFGAAASPRECEKKDEQVNLSASPPQKSNHPSFIHNALRKLSSTGSGGLTKITPQSASGPRRVMNIDQNRDRCKVPELDPAKLRRVAFCVDVEIAGTSRRSSESGDENATSSNGKKTSNGQQSKRRQRSDSKSDSKPADKGDDAALKGTQTADAVTPQDTAAGPEASITAEADNEEKSGQGKELSKKQERKKKSEEERKERKEKKRRLAEENGSIPLQLNVGHNRSASTSKSVANRSQRNQDQPTTDPVRIYRRCCQLRETGVLKKLVEQISSPSSVLAESPGTVAVLDLTGFWMTLQDIITFSDWLAIVPVRKLILNNCGLTDEALRVILAGLLSTKTIDAARYSRGLSKNKGEFIPREERYGAIEKISLKGNPKIGPDGWRHIGLFIHMSRSLKAIDLSGIPFPRQAPPTNSPSSANKSSKLVPDILAIFANALGERFAGSRLEELVLNECYPTTEDLDKICSAVSTLGLRRFGVANNDLTKEGLGHVLRYFKGGHCEGLDLGGNDLAEHIGLISSAIGGCQSLSALSLADCALTPKSLSGLLQSLTTLPNFRFIDLSHNPALFSTQPDALGMIRRYLPQLRELKRIHLADVSLTSEHAIALAEILPDCPKLCHINILENPEIETLASTEDLALQEEACAVYASFTAAVRVSRTLIAIDIDVPTAENNEVVKALASQIVAYSLHNLELGELVQEFSSSPDPTGTDKLDVPVPEILAHIVGHSDDTNEPDNDEELAPDENYVISGTGVVKALGICLGNAESAVETSDSPSASGTTTPVRRFSQPPVAKKPRDMSKNLLDSARKIRMRLRPALVREDRAGNDINYRRLQFLDGTLQRMIQRFEDEFPDTRLPAASAPSEGNTAPEPEGVVGDKTDTTGYPAPDTSTAAQNLDPDTALDDDDGDQFAVRLSRTSSNTSLHSRALTSEEGRVHRLGQHLHRDLFDSELDHAESANASNKSHDGEEKVAALHEKLRHLQDSDSQSATETDSTEKGPEEAEAGPSLEELLELQKQDPEAFATFQESQIAALINAGLRKSGD